MPLIVRDAESFYGRPQRGRSVVETLVARRAAKAGRLGRISSELDDTRPLEVFANHGRWLVRCETCHSAQFASRTDPRFMCVGCWNEASGGRWRPVIWPDELEAIVEALADRAAEHRNWHPGESPAKLADETRRRAELARRRAG